MKNKTALITGGAKGIGKMIALKLAQDGFNIIVSYNTSEVEAYNLVEELRSSGVQSISIRADITKSEDIILLAETALSRMGTVDVIINNAGPFIHERKKFSEYTMEEINYLVNGHFLGIMQLEHRLLPLMENHNWGRIIHFGFDRAHEARGYPLRSVYAASRVALVSYTKTLSVEEAANNITVNMICIGDIRDPYKEMTFDEASELMKRKGLNTRSGTGDDIANIASYLCSEKGSFITGTILDITGGIDPVYQRATMLKSMTAQKKRERE